MRTTVLTCYPSPAHSHSVCHDKLEAASEARYLRDQLSSMISAPVLLGSQVAKSAAASESELLEGGVVQSDVCVLLLSSNVLRQPLCLLELFYAHKAAVPILPLQLGRDGFEAEEARRIISALPTELGWKDPGALALLHEHVGADLHEIQRAVGPVFRRLRGARPLLWDLSVTDD